MLKIENGRLHRAVGLSSARFPPYDFVEEGRQRSLEKQMPAALSLSRLLPLSASTYYFLNFIYQNYFGARRYSTNAMTAKTMLGSHTLSMGGQPAFTAKVALIVWNRI